MNFRVWLEAKEPFEQTKKQLRDEILASLDPNQDPHHVMSTRLSTYKDQSSVYSGANQVIRIFDNNHKIWDLMNKAFPAEVQKANQVRNWLKASGPTDTVGDLFQQIGISSDPIVINRGIKSPADKMPSMDRKAKAPDIKQQPSQPAQGQVPQPFANQVPGAMNI